MKNILILSASDLNYANRRLKEEGKKAGHTIDVISPDSFVLTFPSTGRPQVWAKDVEFANRRYDGVIPRLGTQTEYGCFVLRFLTEFGLPSTATPDGVLNASDKLKTTLILSAAGLRQPATTTVKGPDDFAFLIESVGGLPAICKNLKGSLGDGVYIFRDELQSSVTLQNFRKENKNVLLQQFIETAKADETKSDIRAWVIGDRVVAAMRRFSLASDFRSNYSKSKQAEPVELTNEEKTLAVAAAKALGLDCAGVDIARNVHENGRPYILEVNSNANLEGIEKVTGINVAAKIIAHLEQKINLSAVRPAIPEKHALNVQKIGPGTFKAGQEPGAQDFFKNYLSEVKKDNPVKAMEALNQWMKKN